MCNRIASASLQHGRTRGQSRVQKRSPVLPAPCEMKRLLLALGVVVASATAPATCYCNLDGSSCWGSSEVGAAHSRSLSGSATPFRANASFSSGKEDQHRDQQLHEGTVQQVAAVPLHAGSSTLYSSKVYEVWQWAVGNRKGEDHKRFFPLDRRDGLAAAFAALALFIAAGGGIGGGGVLVPIFIIVLDFPTNIAVALSNITIVGGAISNFLFNVSRRHPHLPRPLIDWDLITVMEPATILGALVGGYLNKAFPNWATTVLLTLILSFMAFKLLKRASSSWAEESREQETTDDDRVPEYNGLSESIDVQEDDEAPEPLLSRPVLVRSSIRLSIDAATASYHEGLHGSPLAYAHRPLTAESAALRWPSLRRVSAQPQIDYSPQGPLLQSFQDNEGHDSAPLVTSVPVQRQQALAEAQLNGGGSLSRAADAHAQQVSGSSVDSQTSPLLDPLLRNAGPGAQYMGASEAGQGPGDAHQGDIQGAAGHKLLQMPQLPIGRISVLVAMFLGVIASDVGKGYLQCGSWQYWLVVLSIMPPVLAITAAVREMLVRRNRQLLADEDYQGYDGEVQWDERTTIIYPAICSLAGLIAGMFGVGGGIVKGPLMLEMGVLPDVASATSATMILFTASSATVVFLSFGGIQHDYAVACFLMGLVVTLLGQTACWWLVRRLHRRSIIVFAMAGLMLLALAVVCYAAVLSTLSAAHEHRLADWGNICARG